MGTWGGAERVVQPTDLGLVGFRVSEGEREDREEDERDTRTNPEALVIGGNAMKERILRIIVTLSGVAAVALAGGATLKPW